MAQGAAIVVIECIAACVFIIVSCNSYVVTVLTVTGCVTDIGVFVRIFAFVAASLNITEGIAKVAESVFAFGNCASSATIITQDIAFVFPNVTEFICFGIYVRVTAARAGVGCITVFGAGGIGNN